MKKLKLKKYPVAGAGDLIFGESPRSFTGNATGYHIAVSWGTHGEAGGVIDWKKALKLAIRIIITLPRVIITIHRRNKQFKGIY
jgi:hypothetical protein